MSGCHSTSLFVCVSLFMNAAHKNSHMGGGEGDSSDAGSFVGSRWGMTARVCATNRG